MAVTEPSGDSDYLWQDLGTLGQDDDDEDGGFGRLSVPPTTTTADEGPGDRGDPDAGDPDAGDPVADQCSTRAAPGLSAQLSSFSG